MSAVLRAIFGYCFLVLMVRVAGRRPGKQMTPFEYVLIFFIGGLTLTGVVADDRSLTNALCQIVTIACVHYVFAWLRHHSSRFSRFLDGTPVILLENGRWRVNVMKSMHFSDEDVMAAAREKGLKNFDAIAYAVVERNGAITVIERPKAA